MGFENSGRRPQPTALKILRGNPGKRKPRGVEPVPPEGAVEKPAGLSAATSAIWDELAPVCLHMGTLTLADVRVFRTLCELQVTLDEAAKMRTDPDSAAVGIRLQREFASIIRPYYALFGLEPVSRARIAVPKKAVEEPQSKWAGALK